MTDNLTNQIENRPNLPGNLSKFQKRRQNSPPTSPARITTFLPNCRCGGHAVWWNEIGTAANIKYWVECMACGKYLPVKKSKEAAIQDWVDWISGVVSKKDLWTVPY